MTKPIRKTRAKAAASKIEEQDNSVVKFVTNYDLLPELCSSDLTKIKKAFGVDIDLKGNVFNISGDIEDCRKAATILERIFDWADSEYLINDEDIDDAISQLLPKPYAETKFKSFYTTFAGKEISPRTKNQEMILKAIQNKQITVLHGCAGTGKTAMAIAMALKLLEYNRFDKIVVVRPMTTVDGNGKNSLGYLPGDISEKTGPYSNAIVQLFLDYVGDREYENLVKSNKICFESLALIRGATFNNTIIILDECQNLSKHEILSCLTRIGTSKMIITGDNSQIDTKIAKDQLTGLECAIKYLKDIPEIGFVEMKEIDIQRAKIVGDIIKAFEE
jgi:phosphate starvation-inducible PhoH-like protein